MQTDKFKKVLKKILNTNPDASGLVKQLSLSMKNLLKVAEDLREGSKKTREYHETIKGLIDWMSQQTKQMTDLNYNSNAKLMKYVKSTWMPIDEGHFADITTENGEYQMAVYLKALAFCKQKNVAVDIGANIGLLSRPMSRDFKEVHSFEPQHAARSCILRNVPNNNTIVYSFGLGEIEGPVTLNSASMAIGGAFIKATDTAVEDMKKTELINQETIHIRKLDSFNFKNIDLVKIDVQGYEIDVLKGGIETFKRCKPVLILEAGGIVEAISGVNPKDALTFATETIGYKVQDIVNKDYILTF